MKRKYEIILILFMLLTVGLPFFSEDSKLQGEGRYRLGKRGPGGGIVFYDKGNYSNGWRYLEAAPKDQSIASPWGCYSSPVKVSLSHDIGAGKINTEIIVASCGKQGAAARLCTGYRGGGKKDWFLPSPEELRLMYWNLYKMGLGNFGNHIYWTSCGTSQDDAVFIVFSSRGGECDAVMGDNSGLNYNGCSIIIIKPIQVARVRAIRAF